MRHDSVLDTAAKWAGDAADFVTQKAAPVVLATLVGASSAYAGDTMKTAPVASQVAPIKVEVTRATLQGLNIDPDSLADFDKLSPPNQGKVLFFLNGLKKAQKFPDTAAEKLPSLKDAAQKLIFLFENDQINQASREAMRKMDGTLEKVRNVERLITQLSDTYGAVLASADSPYGQRFSQEKQEMIATYNEAKKLHDVAKNMESPELQKLRATNTALGQIVATARKH